MNKSVLLAFQAVLFMRLYEQVQFQPEQPSAERVKLEPRLSRLYTDYRLTVQGDGGGGGVAKSLCSESNQESFNLPLHSTVCLLMKKHHVPPFTQFPSDSVNDSPIKIIKYYSCMQHLNHLNCLYRPIYVS